MISSFLFCVLHSVHLLVYTVCVFGVLVGFDGAAADVLIKRVCVNGASPGGCVLFDDSCMHFRSTQCVLHLMEV